MFIALNWSRINLWHLSRVAGINKTLVVYYSAGNMSIKILIAPIRKMERWHGSALLRGGRGGEEMRGRCERGEILRTPKNPKRLKLEPQIPSPKRNPFISALQTMKMKTRRVRSSKDCFKTYHAIMQHTRWHKRCIFVQDSISTYIRQQQKENQIATGLIVHTVQKVEYARTCLLIKLPMAGT